MLNRSIHDLENDENVSDFLSKLLGEMKDSEIKPLTDDEPTIFQEIANKIFKELGSDNIKASVLNKITDKLFLQWRGNTEIGLSMLYDYPKHKPSGTKNTIAKTFVKYGYGCTKYSDFEKKDKKAKESLKA
jgi:hypothetical protein